MRSLAAFNAALDKKNIQVEMFKGKGYFIYRYQIDISKDFEN